MGAGHGTYNDYILLMEEKDYLRRAYEALSGAIWGPQPCVTGLGEGDKTLMGWASFDPVLLTPGSFGRMARLVSPDAGVKGLDIAISEAKAAGVLPDRFFAEWVARLEFQKEAAEEIDAKFGRGGYQ